jgi:AcrR family transcriptional regulator
VYPRDLLASARRVFAERSYLATSAADAGVTERTPFRYFPNKPALVPDEAIALLPEMAELIRERPGIARATVTGTHAGSSPLTAGQPVTHDRQKRSLPSHREDSRNAVSASGCALSRSRRVRPLFRQH